MEMFFINKIVLWILAVIISLLIGLLPEQSDNASNNTPDYSAESEDEKKNNYDYDKSSTAEAIELPVVLVGKYGMTPPSLSHNNSIDNEGDHPTYSYELYDGSLMSSLVAQVSENPQGSGGTTIRVAPAALPDGEDYA
jgi:hypothetical protein